jgi:hypothetical protein
MVSLPEYALVIVFNLSIISGTIPQHPSRRSQLRAMSLSTRYGIWPEYYPVYNLNAGPTV